MLITLDTSNITDADRAVLALVLEGYDGQAAKISDLREQLAEPEKPTRARRTKLEIAYDTAKEAHDADPTELGALVSAAEALKAKDPDNERLKGFDPADYQPTAEPEDETEPEPNTPVPEDNTEPTPETTIETVTELATKLLAGNKARLREILDDFGAKRVGELPEQEYGRFADALRAALSKAKASAESTLV